MVVCSVVYVVTTLHYPPLQQPSQLSKKLECVRHWWVHCVSTSHVSRETAISVSRDFKGWHRWIKYLYAEIHSRNASAEHSGKVNELSGQVTLYGLNIKVICCDLWTAKCYPVHSG